MDVAQIGPEGSAPETVKGKKNAEHGVENEIIAFTL
jgi:hypothetical protein